MISIYKQNMNIHNTFSAVDSDNVNRQTSYKQAEKKTKTE
jgi:hypothetical protein